MRFFFAEYNIALAPIIDILIIHAVLNSAISMLSGQFIDNTFKQF